MPKSIQPLRCWCLLLAAFLILSPGPAWAETWYVKSSRTRMTVDPSGRSRTVGTLSAGQPVNVIGEKGRYYKISVGGKKGYVYKFKLTRKPPAGRKSSRGGGDLSSLLGGQKMAAAESSSASSIRGLSPISEQYGKSQGIPQNQIEAVRQMESFQVSPEEVDRFLEEGGLGPYAR